MSVTVERFLQHLSDSGILSSADAVAKLTHPNIVAAYDADESNGVHFLAMEFVEGVDLAEHVKQHGPVSVADGVNYILQTAKGLEHAHRQGIVHRDIKPGNLLLDQRALRNPAANRFDLPEDGGEEEGSPLSIHDRSDPRPEQLGNCSAFAANRHDRNVRGQHSHRRHQRDL